MIPICSLLCLCTDFNLYITKIKPFVCFYYQWLSVFLFIVFLFSHIFVVHSLFPLCMVLFCYAWFIFVTHTFFPLCMVLFCYVWFIFVTHTFFPLCMVLFRYVRFFFRYVWFFFVTHNFFTVVSFYVFVLSVFCLI